MKFLILFFTFFLSKATEEPEKKYIDINYNYDDKGIPDHFISLTSSNFDSYVQSGKYDRWLIMFYTSTCSFCYQVKTLINKILTEKEFNNNIKFGKIDLSSNLKLQIRFNITHIPYVIMVKNYYMYEMKFLPTQETLTKFLESDNLKDEYERFKQEFPQELSLIKFCYNLMNYALMDGSKRLNTFLKEKNIEFRFTPIKLISMTMIIGVPLGTLFYVFIFNLCDKCKRKSKSDKNNKEKNEKNENNKDIKKDEKIKNE